MKLFFKVKIYLFLQELLVIKYYKNLKYALIDIFQKLIYSFANPYRVSRKFLQKNNCKDIHAYGETPVALFDNLLKQCKLNSSDTFLELGCGRGRLCLFVQQFYGCKVIGVEQIPTFVNILGFIKKIFRIKNMQIVKNDFFKISYSSGTFIYLYGTCLKSHEIISIIKNLKKTNKGAKVLSISFALNEYDNNFQVVDTFSIKLPWGKTKAYLNVKKQ